MKQLLVVIAVCLAIQPARSQTGDTLQVSWNKQLLLHQNNIGGKDSPVIVIKKIWLQKKAMLVITIKPAGKHNNWARAFQFTDTVNNILLQKEFNYTRGNYIFNAAGIETFLQKNKNLLVYSFRHPPGNGPFNNIRIERYLLCKLILE